MVKKKYRKQNTIYACEITAGNISKLDSNYDEKRSEMRNII